MAFTLDLVAGLSIAGHRQPWGWLRVLKRRGDGDAAGAAFRKVAGELGREIGVGIRARLQFRPVNRHGTELAILMQHHHAIDAQQR